MRLINDPRRFKALNGWLTIAWFVSIPPCYLLGWLSSVEFVSALSLYAIVTGHLATWQACRVEVNMPEK